MIYKATLGSIGLAALSFALAGCIAGEGINALLHAGSGTFERANRQREIERVARDWCLTLRASQVIPIYPLREDLEPGTMFVTSSSINNLRSYWNRKGYLPMDSEFDHLPSSLRLAKTHYDGSFGVRRGSRVPDVWRSPMGAGTPGVARVSAWESAPLAAFPSYSFKINRGEAFTGALPIQGIPVMFSALNARSATVSVSLTKCFTYGIPQHALQEAVATWEGKQDNRFELGKYRPVNGQYRWLRVVTRVYLAKSVNVSVTMDKASSAKLSAGAPQPVSNIFIAQGDAAGNYQKAAGGHPGHTLVPAPAPEVPTPLEEPELPKNAEANPLGLPDLNDSQQRKAEQALRARELNQDLQQAKLDKQKLDIKELERRYKVAADAAKFGGTYTPGASVQITSASASSISMNEEFPNPIVIGYEAMDYAIIGGERSGEGGLIDAPVSAFLNMEGRGFDPIASYRARHPDSTQPMLAKPPPPIFRANTH